MAKALGKTVLCKGLSLSSASRFRSRSIFSDPQKRHTYQKIEERHIHCKEKKWVNHLPSLPQTDLIVITAEMFRKRRFTLSCLAMRVPGGPVLATISWGSGG